MRPTDSRRVENSSTFSLINILCYCHLVAINSISHIVFYGHHGDSIRQTIAVGAEGRYLVVLVEVVGLAMLGLGVLMVA